MNRLLLPGALAALALLSPVARAATLTLDNADISGAPGSTIGWGFTLDSPTKYLTVANVTLLPAPSIGVFSDMLSIRFPFEVGPPAAASTSVTEAFDFGLGTGIGSFAIDAGAAPGTVAFATLYVVYNLYNVSPTHDPLFDPFNPAHVDAEGLLFEIPVSVTVSNVPEPSTLGLAGLAIAAVGLRFRRR